MTKDTSYNFKLPVTVTIPYTDAQMESGDIPAVFYWDSTYNKYSAVGVKEIDTVNKTVTFTTVHFSNFVALSIKGLANSLNVDSGFRPGIDGFFHPNFGSYDSPGGSCLGMANYSIWYYNDKKASDGNGLYSKYKDGDPSKWEDDTNARELISRAFIASSQGWANIWWLKDFLLGPDQTGLLLITTMKITKAPQTLIFRGLSLDTGVAVWGHAVTVYKYENGKFYIYDNNYSGEEVTLNWSLLSGFSGYSKYYPSVVSDTF